MKTYKSTQKTVEALQWTGDNKEEVKAFINCKMDFLFNHNSTLTVFPSHSILFPHDYLVKKSDGFISGVDRQYFEEFFEEITPVPVKKTQEREIAESIWIQINDKYLFEDELKIFKMGKRVSWVLKNEHADMVEEAPFFASQVKAELRKIFKENNIEI